MIDKIIAIEHMFFDEGGRFYNVPHRELRPYDVLDKDLDSCPKFFISYNKGRPFISEEVPKEFRRHMVFHELYEFEVLDPTKEDSCLIALKEELSRVPKTDLTEYIRFKTQVFQELITFSEKHDKSLLKKINKSLDYLKTL